MCVSRNYYWILYWAYSYLFGTEPLFAESVHSIRLSRVLASIRKKRRGERHLARLGIVTHVSFL